MSELREQLGRIAPGVAASDVVAAHEPARKLAPAKLVVGGVLAAAVLAAVFGWVAKKDAAPAQPDPRALAVSGVPAQGGATAPVPTPAPAASPAPSAPAVKAPELPTPPAAGGPLPGSARDVSALTQPVLEASKPAEPKAEPKPEEAKAEAKPEPRAEAKNKPRTEAAAARRNAAAKEARARAAVVVAPKPAGSSQGAPAPSIERIGITEE